MDPSQVLAIGVVVGVTIAAVLAAVVVVSARARRPRDRYGVEEPTPICVFCSQPIAETDHVAAMKKDAVRALLGRVPTEYPPTTDPLGNPRWFAHVDCASGAGADLRTAGKVTGALPPPSEDQNVLVCPACGHRFERPAIVISTEDFVRRYGQNAEQCPRCAHVWDPGGPSRDVMWG